MDIDPEVLDWIRRRMQSDKDMERDAVPGAPGVYRMPYRQPSPTAPDIGLRAAIGGPMASWMGGDIKPLPKVDTKPKSWRDDPEFLENLAGMSEGIMRGADQIGDASLALNGGDPRGRRPWEDTRLRNRIGKLRQDEVLGRKEAFTREGWGFQADEAAKRDKADLERAKIAAAGRGGDDLVEPEAADQFDELGVKNAGKMKGVNARALLQGRLNVDRQGGVQGRFDEGMEFRQEMARRLTPEQTKEIADLAGTLKRVRKVRQDFKRNPDAVGPIAGRYNQLIKKIGVGDPDTDVFLANVDELVFSNLYTLSGKQINEPERRDLKQTVFDSAKNGASFEALMANYEERVRDIIETKLTTYEATGRDVGKMRETIPPATGEGVRFTEGSDSWIIPAAKVEAFMRAHPNATRQ